LAFLIALLFAFQAAAQSRTFLTRMEKELPALDTVFALERMDASRQEYDFLAQGMEGLEALFLGHMHKVSRNHPDELTRSQALTIMASAITDLWKGGQYNKGKSWVSVKNYLRRAGYLTTSRFNLLRCAVFRISLVDNEDKQFYYDRHGSTEQLNLFKGKYPSYKERMDEDAPEPEPLKFFTEEEILKQFERELKKQSQFSDLHRGNFCSVGISVKIDEKTLRRKKIPTARIVVLFGARRLKYLKTKTQATRSLANFDLEN
jgi:hypothetical protein